MVNVRVRGIYATAISKILLDSGFKLVEASEKIRERLGLDLETAPCDVTVKDTENPDELLIVGFPKEARAVYSVLVETLKYVFTWASPIELHSVHVGLVVDKQGEYCIVDLGGVKGSLYPCKESPGSKVVVGVKKPPVKPSEGLYLTRNFRLVGKYVALVHGEPRITFSEHIYDAEVKAKLSAIAAFKLMGTGLGVHFRSSSKLARPEDVAAELNLLIEEYRGLLKRVESLEAPAKIRDGEFIAVLSLTSLAKKVLDEYRGGVVFTISMHHSLKSMGLSDPVDFAEHVLARSGVRAHEVASGVTSYLAKSVLESGEVEFVHVKPSGEVVKLSPGRVIRADVAGGRLSIVVKRVMKSEGVYDGLGVEKKPGDVDYVLVDSSKPLLSHNYFRGDSWLGSYININTPPEVGPKIIKYHDLLVDVVVYPSGEVKVLDLDELEDLHRGGVVTETLYEYARKAAEQVLSDPSSYVFNPLKSLKSYSGAGVPELGQRGRA